MAITRAQQAKQLLALGGRIGLQGGGRDSGKDPGPETGRPGRDDREIGARESRTRAMAIANQRALAALGDPDPEVDVPISQRQDTITDFGKNLRKNLTSNPFSMITPLGVLIKTSFQTNKARKELGLPGFDFEQPEDEEEGEGQQIPFYLRQMMMPKAPSIVAPETEEKKLEGLRLAFRAEGGSINDQIRQAYGLGSIVKKATRAVKKVAKSDIGKAALLYAATGGLGNLAAGQSFFTGFTSPTTFLGKSKLANIFTRQGLGNIGSSFGLGSMISEKTAGDAVVRKFAPNLLGKALTSPTGIITAVSLLPLLGLGTGDESEEEAQAIIDQSGLDINAIREAYLGEDQYRARRFKAEGGSMKEPVAKKTMPLLDMGGQEMDLRAEGGFVPIGRMEKADDVPARLSKNEFVFTADAVRNAGDGNVDKGAEVMYNMMKNLEAGGDVSEESQGLEGARRMFQTSQRLEEVL